MLTLGLVPAAGTEPMFTPAGKMNFLRGQDNFFQTANQPISVRHLTRIDWNTKLNNLNNNINETTNDVIKTFEEISNKHAPVKEVPHSKLKQFTKPWITNGILKSIKTKQKMYYTHFLSNENKKLNNTKYTPIN